MTHAPAKLEVCNVRGGIQKFVDKLNIFFMHYRIVTKTSHLKHSYLEHLQVINQIDSDVHNIVTVTIATSIHGKCRTSNFQTLILVFILIRFMNFLQITPEMFYKYLNFHCKSLTFCLPTGHFWATSSTPLSVNGPLLGHLFSFDF